MPRAIVVQPEQRERLRDRMYQIEISYTGVVDNLSSYWWNIYLIKRDEDWRADFDEFEDWLGDFAVQSFGPSRATFYSVMGAIERFKRIGKTDEEIQGLLGRRKVALEGDFKELFDNNGRGEMRPEVVQRIEAGGESIGQFVDRIAEAAPAEARRIVQSVQNHDTIYALQDETVYDENTGCLLINMQWENSDDGLIWRGTVKISAEELTESRPSRPRNRRHLPTQVADYIKKRLGVR